MSPNHWPAVLVGLLFLASCEIVSSNKKSTSQTCDQSLLTQCNDIKPQNSSAFDFCRQLEAYQTCLGAIVCDENDDDASVIQLLQSSLINSSITYNKTCQQPAGTETVAITTNCTQLALDNCTLIKPQDSSTAEDYCRELEAYKMCLDAIVCNGSVAHQQLQSELNEVNITYETTCQPTVEMCSDAALSSCMMMKPTLSSTVDKLWTNDDYNRFCEKVTVFGDCLANYNCPSTDNPILFGAYKQLIGNLAGFQYMCTEQARAVYVSNQRCVIVMTKSFSDSCRENTLSADETNVDKCRYQNDFYACVYLGMKYNCSEQIARMTSDFNLRKYGPPLQASINCILVSPYSPCGQASIDNCSAILPSDLRDNMTFQWSSADYDRFCAQIDSYDTCVSKISCIKGVDIEFMNLQTAIGKRNMYHYMCTSDFRSVVMSSFNCVSKAGSASALTCYNSSFPTHLDEITAGDVCSYYTAQLKCMYDAVRHECNEAAARVFVTSLAVSYQPVLRSAYDCQLDIVEIMAGNSTTTDVTMTTTESGSRDTTTVSNPAAGSRVCVHPTVTSAAIFIALIAIRRD